MKELKDLLKADKYLEAKAFILSNLDKIEECIDDVLEELADMSSLRPLCITTEEINQDLKEELVKRMGEETKVHPRYTPPAQYADKSLLPHVYHAKDVTIKIGGMPIFGVEDNENFIKADPCNITHEGKKISCHISKIVQMGDEHNIVDPKGLGFSYLKAQYNAPNEKIDTLIKKTIKTK